MTAAMRFGIYIRTVESARGAERSAINVARGFAERGHLVDFLIEEEGDWLVRELCARRPEINIVNLRDSARARPWDPLFRMRSFAQQILSAPCALLRTGDPCLSPIARVLWKDAPPLGPLLRYLQVAKPQAVLSFLNYPNVVLMLAARMFRGRTRFVVSVRNHISTAAANSESKWGQSVPRLMRGLFRHADAVVAPSQGVAEDVVALTGLAPARVAVVYNPVYRSELATLADAPVDHRWLAAGNEPVVLGSGKFKPQKDFPTLLAAFAKVRAARPARLVVLGVGKGGDELKAQAESLGIAADVDFPGHVQNPFAYYRRASVFVLSSLWEGLPNALIEALACGCPVVSTDCASGPREILDNGRYGALVPVRAVEEMASAILGVLDHPPARAPLVARAKDFSLELAVSRFEAVLSG